MKNYIYIITWTGRDTDSEVWDEYPVYRYGYYTDAVAVEEKVKKLNQMRPAEYDTEAGAVECYSYRAIKQAED